jgi:hypothetical protein
MAATNLPNLAARLNLLPPERDIAGPPVFEHVAGFQKVPLASRKRMGGYALAWDLVFGHIRSIVRALNTS